MLNNASIILDRIIHWPEIIDYIKLGPFRSSWKSSFFKQICSTEDTLKSYPLNTSDYKMSKPLSHAKIVLRRSADRGHADHGWLNSYHTFSFAGYFDRRFQNFGSLRVLNEDRVASRSGFPTHPHRDAEIFSYILSGELTHRDSMVTKGAEGEQGKQFYRMKRGDVQFTTGGTGQYNFFFFMLSLIESS